MTCVAWDGKTLAADKRVTYVGLARTVTKIFRVGEALVGFAGDGGQCMEVLEWIQGGCVPDKFPASQRDKDQWSNVVVVRAGGVWSYERSPFPIRIEDGHYAAGSGRDYALAAMHLGKTAAEAVEIACIFDVSCGNGVDTLELATRVAIVRGDSP